MNTRNYTRRISDQSLVAYFSAPFFTAVISKGMIVNAWLIPSSDLEIIFELNRFYSNIDTLVIDNRYFFHGSIPIEYRDMFKCLSEAKPLKIPIAERQRIYDYWFPIRGNSVLNYGFQRTYHPLYYLLFPDSKIDSSLENGIREYFLNQGYLTVNNKDSLYPPLWECGNYLVKCFSFESAIVNLSRNILPLKRSPYSLINLDFVLTIISLLPEAFSDWYINFYTNITDITNHGEQTLSPKQTAKLFQFNSLLYAFFYRKALHP